MTVKVYNHKEIEPKWQAKWEKEKLYSPNISNSKNKFYNLWMFPYPSAEGLHAGHAFASTGSDIAGRFMRMNGKDVFQPIGYDSFGIHSENFALKTGETPQKMLERTTKHYEDQLRSLGHGYDWTKTVTTSDMDYYRWTQWLFVEMFKAGLAYKTKALVNWCPSCKTVLSDEQVMTPAQAGKVPAGFDSIDDVPEGTRVCERCGTIVEKKELSQWFFRITDYVQRLLDNLEKIDWSERVKVAQRGWIGRSEGALVKFNLKGGKTSLEVFTTRPDTIKGVTFMAVSPEKAQELINLMPESVRQEVENYITRSLSKTDQIRKQGEKQKTGVDTGLTAINPVTKEEIPVWVADYVLSEVGTGALMGVPAGDERDKDFAEKHNLPIIEFEPYREKLGSHEVRYHLRDWLISRQRYWGPPIPMIYCEACAKAGDSWFSSNKASLHTDQSDWEHSGWYPEENLPVKLPELTDYEPEGTGSGPLAKHPEFYEVNCPHCGGKAERETDVSDTFVDSSWYFLRYPSIGSPGEDKKAFDDQITKAWLPVDLYFGGAEHAVLHLMYARFVTMALFDLKKLAFEEPFPKFFAHGLMIKDGAKMSKSRGNVVNPDEYIEKFGADTLRLYVMFLGPMDGSPDFRDEGIEGMSRFIGRLLRLVLNHKNIIIEDKKDAQKISVKMHQTIKKVTNDVKNFRYNTAIASIMEFVNLLEEQTKRPVRNTKFRCAEWEEAIKTLVLLLAPFVPHIAEEIWCEVLENKFSVHTANWPTFDPDKLIVEEVVIVVQVNGKLRSQLTVSVKQSTDKDEILTLAKKEPNVAKWLKGKASEAIFVPRRLINFVIK